MDVVGKCPCYCQFWQVGLAGWFACVLYVLAYLGGSGLEVTSGFVARSGGGLRL